MKWAGDRDSSSFVALRRIASSIRDNWFQEGRGQWWLLYSALPSFRCALAFGCSGSLGTYGIDSSFCFRSELPSFVSVSHSMWDLQEFNRSFCAWLDHRRREAQPDNPSRGSQVASSDRHWLRVYMTWRVAITLSSWNDDCHRVSFHHRFVSPCWWNLLKHRQGFLFSFPLLNEDFLPYV